MRVFVKSKERKMNAECRMQDECRMQNAECRMRFNSKRNEKAFPCPTSRKEVGQFYSPAASSIASQ